MSAVLSALLSVLSFVVQIPIALITGHPKVKKWFNKNLGVFATLTVTVLLLIASISFFIIWFSPPDGLEVASVDVINDLKLNDRELGLPLYETTFDVKLRNTSDTDVILTGLELHILEPPNPSFNVDLIRPDVQYKSLEYSATYYLNFDNTNYYRSQPGLQIVDNISFKVEAKKADRLRLS